MFSTLKKRFYFLSHVFTLGIGSSIAQIITIGISPFLTRLYTPEDFGIWALYMSLVGILSIIATGKYELAIILPDKTNDAFSLVSLVFLLSCCVSIFALFIVFYFKSSIMQLLGNTILEDWLFLIPLNVFLMGIAQAFIYWGYREKHYKNIMYNRISQNSVTAIINCLLGLLSSHAIGLIVGTLIGQCFSSILLLKYFWLREKNLIFISRSKILSNAIRYRNFLFYSMPMGILNIISFNLVQYCLMLFFNSTILGYYYLVQRILSIPLDIVSSSFSPVFYKELGITSSKVSLLLKAFSVNLLLGFFWVLPFLYFGEDIFGYIFGYTWRESGKLCLLIAPLIIMSFASGSISGVFSYFQKNEILLYWQIIYCTGFAFLLFLYQDHFNYMIQMTSLFGSLMYLGLFFLAFILVRKEGK